MRLVRSVLEKSWGRWRERKGLRTGTEAQAMAKVSSTCLFCRSREWGLIGKGGGGGGKQTYVQIATGVQYHVTSP